MLVSLKLGCDLQLLDSYSDNGQHLIFLGDTQNKCTSYKEGIVYAVNVLVQNILEETRSVSE